MSSIDLNQRMSSVGLNTPYDKQEFFSLGVNLGSSENYRTYTPNSVEKNRESWDFVYWVREKIVDTPELAAQEKYAYARYDVSAGGIPAFLNEIALNPGYQVLKSILPSKWLESGSRQVSPPSFDQFLKGLEGAIDGLKDYLNSESTVSDNRLLDPSNDSGSDYRLLDPSSNFGDLQKSGNEMQGEFQKPLNDSGMFRGESKGSFHEGRETGLGDLADGRSLGERPERDRFRF